MPRGPRRVVTCARQCSGSRNYWQSGATACARRPMAGRGRAARWQMAEELGLTSLVPQRGGRAESRVVGESEARRASGLSGAAKARQASEAIGRSIQKPRPNNSKSARLRPPFHRAPRQCERCHHARARCFAQAASLSPLPLFKIAGNRHKESLTQRESDRAHARQAGGESAQKRCARGLPRRGQSHRSGESSRGQKAPRRDIGKVVVASPLPP
jgi:hypothetical protein